MNDRLKEELKNKINFIIVAFTTFLGIGIIPFLTTAFDDATDEEIIKSAFPDSKLGWTIWVIFRLMIVIINLSIFTAFVNQGRMNVNGDLTYKESNKKWIEIQIYRGKCGKKGKKSVPDTPKQHYAKLYTKKGLALSIGSFASCFTVTMVILHWDLATFIVICLTVAFAIVFGFLQMQKEEYYWLNDFKVRVDVEYEKMIKEEQEEREHGI